MRRLAPATCDNGWGFCLILPSFQQLQQLGGYWLRCARLQSGRLPNRDFLIYRFVGCGWADGAKWIMPLAHPGLQSSRTPLVPWHRQRKFSANWPRALILGTSLFATLNSSSAQDTGAPPSGKPNPLYPDEAEITFQWNYECPTNRPCTFVCHGAGGAGGGVEGGLRNVGGGRSDHVTRLDIYLGTLPFNGIQQERPAAIFYDFSSREFPHSAGFVTSTGINSLSCQVNGMILKYSGPPPKKPKPGPTEDVPLSQNGG
jgi:hypothetical protein